MYQFQVIPIINADRCFLKESFGFIFQIFIIIGMSQIPTAVELYVYFTNSTYPKTLNANTLYFIYWERFRSSHLFLSNFSRLVVSLAAWFMGGEGQGFSVMFCGV